MRKHHRKLGAKALGRQDHTTSPSASLPLVNRHTCVHRIPASRVVTFAKRPSEDRGGMTQPNADFRKRASGIFSRAGLEPTNTFDSAEQISTSAHLDWLAKRACELPENSQSARMLPVGQITFTHPAAWRSDCLSSTEHDPARHDRVAASLTREKGHGHHGPTQSNGMCLLELVVH